MKLKIMSILLMGFVSVSHLAIGQNNTTKQFVPNSSASDFSILKITEKEQITASFMKGKIDGKDALSVVLENNRNESKNVVCKVKENTGRVVLTGEILINSGEKIAAFHSDKLNGNLVFIVPEGKKATDYQVELILK
ncbi:MAG: hypothetical protein HUU48_12235 [Flavobacteriales bacterium]|nr:hypothetical protein [Flavobacteriales bacterium]